MKFIVTFIALVIERFFDWSHLRKWQWYTRCERFVTKRFPALPPYLLLALVIVPLLIIVVVLQCLLRHVLFGLMGFLFQLFIFLYCLGPQNLWADAFACMNAMTHDDQDAENKLKTSFGVSSPATSSLSSTSSISSISLHRDLLNNIFLAANSRIFAIVFWFMVLGPVGAVLYRTVSLSAGTFPQLETAPELIQSARSIRAVLDWLPVRILSCLFALGGHFVKTFSCWRKPAFFNLKNNEQVLIECGTAALGSEELDHLPAGAAEKNAIGLLDRSFVIALAIIALMIMLR